MYSIGNEVLLKANPVAIYCSREIPLSIYQPALELVQTLMTIPLTLAGGWQSALEKASLKTRTPGSPSNIIFFIAKGVQGFKIPLYLREDLDARKVLLVSPFMEGKRIDKRKVAKRDDLILSLINRFLFLNIDEGGNLDKLFNQCLNLKKEVFLLNHFSNHGWAIGNVELISSDKLGSLL